MLRLRPIVFRSIKGVYTEKPTYREIVDATDVRSLLLIVDQDVKQFRGQSFRISTVRAIIQNARVRHNQTRI